MANRFWQALAIVAAVTLSGCEVELSQDEKAFYKRSAEFDAGDSLSAVGEALGPPDRMVTSDEQMCRDAGGTTEWVYESVPTSSGGRRPLRAGWVVFCADEKGVVRAKLSLHVN